jgi:hypothetical protein
MAKVIKVDDLRARNLIELYTAQHCFPDVIKFVQDGAGNLVMSPENLSNLKYTHPDPETTAAFTTEHQTTQPFKSISEIIAVYGVEIDYIPHPDILLQ